MNNPQTTYRIQFNKDFTFKDFEEVLPYLHDLGVKSIYASPIFEAVPGSTHGYDGINPNRINPEIGTLAELRSISARLKELKMSWIQDIVPNHMGFHHLNLWLMDVLEKGDASAYRNYFDILSQDLSEEPLMAPFLGDSLEKVLKTGDLQLVTQDEASFFKYHDSYWPLKAGTDLHKPVESIISAQYYRLCCYKESNESMNYRRFFTVNSLICLNMQNQETFHAYHQLTKQLLKEGIFQGLRIDHVDGLYDPQAYLQALRHLAGPETYIVVEKILEPGESLPAAWPVQGTTGYDFLGLVNQVFVNQKAEKKFNEFYEDFEQEPASVQKQIREKKTAYLYGYMNGELDNLFQLFQSLQLVTEEEKALSNPKAFKELIAEILVRCPVYRYYGNRYPLPSADQQALQSIFSDLGRNKAAVSLLNSIFFDRRDSSPDYQQRVLHFYQRMMQFTGPLMAKGVEDTLMYTYNRFIGSNEVGDSPDIFGITVADFHQAMLERQEQWPLTMNASGTHDTKRGEDARARLQVLTGLRAEWIEEVQRWHVQNSELLEQDMPDRNDEYFIYQTLLATYPELKEELPAYAERLQLYLEKALRESKRNSSWEEPHIAYEERTKKFITRILDDSRPFWGDFKRFHGKVSALGRLNSLASMVLKFACPGVPDTYQGDGLWDLSMVDPDNRRPVDYALRAKYLVEVRQQHANLGSLWQEAVNGKIKLFLLQQLMRLRSEFSLLFAEGQYLPLKVKGKGAPHIMSFARRFKQDWLIFVLALNPGALGISEGAAISVDVWENTSIVLPEGIPGKYVDCLKKGVGNAESELLVREIFKDFPMAILHFKQQRHKRAAGVLMPVFSLPSTFGIGDFGPEARAFVDFLTAAGQKYWQVLPLNPVSASQSYSPYSGVSVMAGNTLFISPELLMQEQLLTKDNLEAYLVKGSKKVKYKELEKSRNSLLSIAYENFVERGDELGMLSGYQFFCEQEANWLNDYALFEALKESYGGKTWSDWPHVYRTRDRDALQAFVKRHTRFLEQTKWEQYIFQQQWLALKRYANSMGIQLIGDLPFYAALDAVDVWARPELFSMDENGMVKGMAGVPPDYFNEEGQLWGMPVYNWAEMAAEDYSWWQSRMRRNMEMYDLIRLDHFRAFSGYWEVPAGSATARTGRWQPGPGIEFFEALRQHFKQLPFLAEDLGEIDAAVYKLRDRLKLPGMKVLQFAFDEDAADAIHAPHNFLNQDAVVYTGTHDNNTIVGWYKNDIGKADKKRIRDYVGHKVSKQNIHEVMIRLAYSSIAGLVIIPMQDLLGKGAKARMNTPASTEGNWLWRLKPGSPAFTNSLKMKLRDMTARYGR